MPRSSLLQTRWRDVKALTKNQTALTKFIQEEIFCACGTGRSRAASSPDFLPPPPPHTKLTQEVGIGLQAHVLLNSGGDVEEHAAPIGVLVARLLAAVIGAFNKRVCQCHTALVGSACWYLVWWCLGLPTQIPTKKRDALKDLRLYETKKNPRSL